MRRSDDLTLVVLKGHLLVEEELNEILSMKLRVPEAIFQARLSFSQRLAVLRALAGDEGRGTFSLDALNRLNALRNQLAHNLEPRQLEKRVKAFLVELEAPGLEEEFSQEKLSTRLKRCIALLCGRLSGWRQGLRSLQIPLSDKNA